MEGEPEPVKSAEAPVYHSGPRPVPRPRKSQMTPKHSIAEAAGYSVQVAVQEFKKSCEPKVSKLKGGHLANITLIFNSWLKDINMCVCEHNLTEHKAVQLVKDYTTEHALELLSFISTWTKIGVTSN